MKRVYLMQRFDMNERFPDSSYNGIEPYLSATFVLFHEDGSMIPFEENGFGDSKGLSDKVVKGLESIQSKGFQIMEVYILFLKRL